jgi:selenocysteine lyase/cysteine desulfurase
MDANIRKFEEIGTHPAAVHNALGEAIAFNRALGIDRKAARLRYLHSLWQDQVRDLPRIKFLTNIDDESNQCGLRLVHIEGTDPGKLSAWLHDKHRIFTVSIGHEDFKGLRVAPSVYTTTAEIERFAQAMKIAASTDVKEIAG